MRGKALAGVLVATVLFATAMLGLSASSAGAVGTVTITVGTPTVTNKLLVTVPVQVVCSPQNGDPTVMDFVHVDLSQANSNKSVTTGSGQVAGGPGDFFTNNVGPFLTCDGATVNNVSVNVQGDGQYKGGGAIITVTASQSVGTCNFGCTTASESGTVGPMGINLRG